MKKMPNFMIRIKVTDDKSRVVSELHEQGHSWTRNGYILWLTSFSGVAGGGSNAFGAGNISAKRSSGIIDYNSNYCFSPVGYSYNNNHFVTTSLNSNSAGICVGTGNAAFSVENYDLAARIVHGTGPGQLSYGAQSAVASNYNSSLKEWTIINTRQFNNASGADIIIAEIGLDFFGKIFASINYQYLAARDVLSTPITVQNGYNIDVAYETTFDFSAID